MHRHVVGSIDSIVMGVPPIAGWFIRENPIKVDDWCTPISGNHHILLEGIANL